MARNTVRAALRAEGPPRYERAATGSIVDAVEPRVLELLREFPTMPATVIAERVGWTNSIRVLRDRVAELRPLFVPPDPCQRTHYFPGELAQFDLWQPDVEIPRRPRSGRQAVGDRRCQRLLPVRSAGG